MIEKINLGEDSLDSLESYLNQKKPNSILVVTGKKSYADCGAKSKIELILKNFRHTRFSDFQANPKIEDVKKGVDSFLENKCDLIIAVGGGSSIDMSKLILFFWKKDLPYKKHFNSSLNVYDLVPLVAVPTTAGSGSEATHFAVVYHNNTKYSISDKLLLPELVCIYPEFTYDIDSYLTACTGFDALSQAIESFWNINSTKESDELAEKAIRLIWKNLPEVVKRKPNKKSRQLMSEGALYAGQAINITKTTGPHAFSYPFSIFYDFPHGNAVALSFPSFMYLNYGIGSAQLSPKMNEKVHLNKMNTLYSMLGVKNPEHAKELMTDYILSLGLVMKLPDDFDKDLILKNINPQRSANNPVIVSPELANQVINDIMNHD